MAPVVELKDLLKDMDLTRADSRVGLGALLREVDERLKVCSDDVDGAGRCPVTTVYNVGAAAGLDHAGVACGD